MDTIITKSINRPRIIILDFILQIMENNGTSSPRIIYNMMHYEYHRRVSENSKESPLFKWN